VIFTAGAQKDSGGVTIATVLSSGGAEYVYSGGVASGSIASAGGYLFVSSGATASADVVSGGTVTVLSGGSLTGGQTIAAGSAVISGTAAAGQTISFTGATGDLVLANLPSFGAKIAGMTGTGQKVDLVGFAYNSATESASWSQGTGSGTLTVTDGAQVAHLTLIGTYVTSNFTLSTDGAGGTFVVDPPLRHGVASFVQAMAVMGGGGLFNEAPSLLSSGGGAFTSAVIPTGGVSAFG